MRFPWTPTPKNWDLHCWQWKSYYHTFSIDNPIGYSVALYLKHKTKDKVKTVIVGSRYGHKSKMHIAMEVKRQYGFNQILDSLEKDIERV